MNVDIDPSKLDPRFAASGGVKGGVVVLGKAAPPPPQVHVDRAKIARFGVPDEVESAILGGGGGGSGHGGGLQHHHREQKRLTTAKGSRIGEVKVGHIGGDFKRTANPPYLKERAAIYDRIISRQKEEAAKQPREAIKITLPNGSVLDGTSFETTPQEIAKKIANSLAKKAIVAKVAYTRRVGHVHAVTNTGPEDDPDLVPQDEEEAKAASKPELWDIFRPLEGDCELQIKTFEDPEGKMVFWHSSAHVLGECMECDMGVKLCIGPPTADGFYYDAYMGMKENISDADYKPLKKKALAIAKEKQTFERIVLSKDEALELFADNPFKVALINAKIPDGGITTAYRCGPLIDLCPGPHIADTGKIKDFEILNHSGTNWLGQVANDPLQRIYGISFPDKKLMKKHLFMLAEAKKRDHRVVGVKQDLFFFDPLSPGSCFFQPAGAHIYRKLMNYLKKDYRKRGYDEVITPNVFNLDLWHISGHAKHYLENMFTFDVEGQQFGLKPMNCPGHCLMYKHRVRSYRELPLRWADFGVLHRNEASGALTGLTRVRRFQQDDAHIFCRFDQIEQEIEGVLDFIDSFYKVLGFTYRLDLSTRPEKALGAKEVWDKAESMMKDALSRFGRPWRLNPGDGAFYGPKIDIKVFDALGRAHQLATCQLDFQLPIRFDLRYKTSGDKHSDSSEKAESKISGDAPAAVSPADEKLPPGYARPVIVHRAILGSVERMIAILVEHTNGKWPMWMNPRQIMVVPIGLAQHEYAQEVRDIFFRAGFEAYVELSSKTMQAKVREAQLSQFNFIFVVGAREAETRTVNIRIRDQGKKLDAAAEESKDDDEVAADAAAAAAAAAIVGEKSIEDTLKIMAELVAAYK